MQSVTISENTLRQLGQAAALRGMDINAYAEELLAISLAAVREATLATRRTHSAMESSIITPPEQATSYTEIVPGMSSATYSKTHIPHFRVGQELAKRLVKTIVEDPHAKV